MFYIFEFNVVGTLIVCLCSFLHIIYNIIELSTIFSGQKYVFEVSFFIKSIFRMCPLELCVA